MVAKMPKNCHFLDRRRSWWKISQNGEPFLLLFIDNLILAVQTKRGEPSLWFTSL